MEPILTLDHLSYAYHTLEGETKALSDISLSVKPGELWQLSVHPDAASPHCSH